MKLSNVQEEYLKTIYLLNKKEHKARVTDIANELKKTKPTVNYTVNNLKEEGFVNYEAYGDITLTKSGEKQARKILEAYDISYLFLHEILKLDESKSKEEADKMKATLSDETLNKLAVYVHNELGLINLDCGYDINKEKCISCLRRTETKFVH